MVIDFQQIEMAIDDPDEFVPTHSQLMIIERVPHKVSHKGAVL